MTVVVRAAADPSVLMPAIRRELSAIDRDVPISDVHTMDAVVAASTSQPRLRTVLVGAFAALAMLLATIGVAGMTAYAVTRRTREIGVRVALGATRRTVVRMMLAQSLAATAGGAAAGLAASLLLTRLLSGLLFDVIPTDPGTYATATAVLIVAALAATFLPARRAARIDPMISLRAE